MALKDSDILNLPEASDFLSEPPRYSVSEMIQICEKMLPYWNKIRAAHPPQPFIGEACRLLEDD